MKKKNNTVKLNKFFLLGVVFLFVAIVVKLCYVALSAKVDDIDLKAFADNRNTAKQTLYAKRGSIYDITGEILAQSVNSYTVIAFLAEARTTDLNNPQHVTKKEETAKKLAPVIGTSEERILELLQFSRYQVELARGITELTKEAVVSLDLDGIGFVATSKRYYKMSNFASYTIGYARKDDAGEMKGYMGIESVFNDTLKGQDGYREYQRDAYGYQIPNTPAYTPVEPIDGSDVYLTIDNQIQIIVENALKNLKDYQMDWVTLTLADAKTGAIVATASTETFDLNTLNGLESYTHPLVAHSYEPGSTMKVFSFLAAIEDGKYDGAKKFQSGTYEVADVTIKDSNSAGWGVISYDEGFNRSSNIAATHLALALGTDKLKTYYRNAGFGSRTGIALPGELPGIIDFKYQTELANASFGHGITVTPIQLIQGFTAIANDGVVVKPYIVDKIVDQDGNITFQAKREELNRIASSASTKQMKEMMSDAVTSGLTDAKYYQSDIVSVIGKTGTAQIAEGGRYLTGKYDYIRSFAGLFPKEDPQYIIYISARKFVGPYTEISNAAKTVIEEVAKIKNISDEKSALDESKIIEMKNYISSDILITKEELENRGLKVYTIGTGSKIVNQYPLKNTKVIFGSKVFLLSNNFDYKMPNMINWTSSEVRTYCNLIGLKVNFEGFGSVIEQSIDINNNINPDDTLTIKLSN